MAAYWGAVLTGGASRRMGRDKALIEIDGRRFVDRVAAALEQACSRVVAVGPAALAGSVEPVADRWPGEGPLGAILTILEALPPGVPGAVVAACDLPWLDGATVAALVHAAATAGCDASVAHTDRVEPLCAAWNRSAAAHVRTSFEAGERAVHAVLAGLHVVRVEASGAVLRNVNLPGDVPNG